MTCIHAGGILIYACGQALFTLWWLLCYMFGDAVKLIVSRNGKMNWYVNMTSVSRTPKYDEEENPLCHSSTFCIRSTFVVFRLLPTAFRIPRDSQPCVEHPCPWMVRHCVQIFDERGGCFDSTHVSLCNM